MNQKIPWCFEVCLKNENYNSQGAINNYEKFDLLLKYLAQICNNFVFSLRYLYSPSSSSRLRSFVLINPISQVKNNEIFEKLNGLLTKGSLSQFYVFNYREEGFPNLNGVTSIAEVIKYGEFIEKPDFIGYLPHFFVTDLTTRNFSLLELIEGAGYNELVLEFSLETYNLLDEQELWICAVEDLISRLSNSNSKSNYVRKALELYRKYQSDYSRNQLFSYSIKSLGRNLGETFTILQTLVEIVGNKDMHRQANPIVTYSPSDPHFVKSLQATQGVRIFKEIKCEGWEKVFLKKLDQKLIKETVKAGGLLSIFDDGSLSFPILPSSFGQSSQLKLTSSDSSSPTVDTNTGGLVLDKTSLLSRISEPKLPKIEHLKPLNRITTYQEVIGFFKIFQTQINSSPVSLTNEKSKDQKSSEDNMFESTLEITELVQKYGKKITEDTYIVGIEKDGTPCLSSWKDCPHRVVAGTPGSGKTNFLFSLIYQLLFANQQSKIYLADFQAGLHFHIVASKYENIKMVTQIEDFTKLLQELVDIHGQRRDLMISHTVRSRDKLQLNSGIKLDRIFLIIDEAFFIQNADGTNKKEIEKHLTTLAAQARVTGIHIVYCSQSPNLLNKNIKASIEERVVFRVANNNESLGLLDNFAALGLEQGMCVHRRISYDPKSPIIIKVPLVPDEVWDQPIH